MIDRPEISVIVPVFNEENNIPSLYDELTTVLESLDKRWEVVAVDDGSTDASFARLAEVHHGDPRWRIIRFRRNFGQTAAFSAGFEQARAPIVVTMDADLQNDPKDIPRFLQRLDEGFDIVSGWRVKRKGGFFSRRLPSFVANRLISSSTGVVLTTTAVPSRRIEVSSWSIFTCTASSTVSFPPSQASMVLESRRSRSMTESADTTPASTALGAHCRFCSTS